MYLMGPCLGSPVDRPALEIVISADAVRRRRLVRDRVAEKAALPTKTCPLLADRAVDLVSPTLRRPEDCAALEMIVATNSIRRSCLVHDWVAQQTAFPSKSCPPVANRAVHLVS